MAETQNTEFKTSWRDEFLKWICGFANASGGIIYIGTDDNGNVTGIKNSKRLMDDIPNKIQTNLGILCDVNLQDKDGKQFLEIIVDSYDVPISYHGKYYYRSGSTNQELKGSVLQQFLLKKIGKTWDDVEEISADMSEIDSSAVQTFIKQAQKANRIEAEDSENTTHILDNLDLLKDGKPKRAAVLLFGKKPTRFYPNAFLKIGKFGETDDDLLFQDVVEGNIFEMADKAITICRQKHFRNPIRYEGLTRIEDLEYPYLSL